MIENYSRIFINNSLQISGLNIATVQDAYYAHLLYSVHEEE